MKNFFLVQGLVGKSILDRKTVISLTLFYLLILFYMWFIVEVRWLSGGIPDKVIYAGVSEFSASLLAVFINGIIAVMYLFQIYLLTSEAKLFHSKTTMTILFANKISGYRLYTSFLLKRFSQIVILNVVTILPIVIMFLIRDGVFLSGLLKEIYLLTYASFVLVLYYDVVFYLTRNYSFTSSITTISVVLFLLLSYSLKPLLFNLQTDNDAAYLLNVIPDFLSMSYHYLLVSFDMAYSVDIFTYPLIFVIISILLLALLVKNFTYRFLTE